MKESKNVIFFIIGILIIMLIYFTWRDIQLNQHPVNSVAMVYNISVGKYAVYYADYKYYYKGKEYTKSKQIENSKRDEYLNSYFEVKFSSKNPEYCKIYFEKKVVNKDIIEEAGF